MLFEKAQCGSLSFIQRQRDDWKKTAFSLYQKAQNARPVFQNA